MIHLVMFSGGAMSWAAARRVVAMHGKDAVRLIFSDTKMEDPDLYRFLEEGASDVGAELVKIADGRNPWQVFRDVRFLGNTRIDPCSRILKRDLIRKWVEAHYEPDEATIYLGLDWTETHRLERSKGFWKPYALYGPMCDPPYLEKRDVLEEMIGRGIQPPALYALGFPHNNCGGFCVKAGQAHFALLLRALPERYADAEREEQELRDHLGKDVAILRDRRGGTTRPMTLREFRERVQCGQQIDAFDWGGCGCMSDG